MSSGTSQAFATSAPPATKPVANVTWNLPQEPSSLDPVKVFNSSDEQVNANVCESLLVFNADGELQPNLATSVDTADPTTEVIHLRPGVKFSDGRPMTAADVVFSLKRVLDPKSGSYWSAFGTRVKNIAATNRETVTVTLTQADAVFYRMLATPMGQVIEKQAALKAGSALGGPKAGIVCTGPYVLGSWQKGSSLTLVANKSWWKAAKQPILTKKIKFSFISNESTLASALVSGEVDGTFVVPTGASLTKLQSASNGKVYFGPSTSQFALIPTRLSGAGPLVNPLVRQALAKSIDYNGIISTIYGASGAPLRAIVPPGAFGYAKSTYQAAYDALPKPTLDVAGAKKLLAQAHQPHPTITIAVPSSADTFVSIAEAIQSSAAQAGFTVKIKPLSDAQFSPLYSSQKARATVDAFLSDWLVDDPDPLELYQQIGTPGSPTDFGGYRNATVTTLLQQASTTMDDTKRAELVVKAQAQISKDEVWLPITYELGTMFLNNRLGGATATSLYNLYTPWAAQLGAR